MADGQLVTARGSRDGWQWMREFIKLLKQAENGRSGRMT